MPTKIEWTATVHPDGTVTPGETWNPIRARRRDGQPNKAGGGWICQRVSPGCVNCYAAGINKRLGTGLDYDARGIADSDIYLDERILAAPLRWKRPRRVFVCSMTDLFGEWVPFEMIDRVFAVMALAKSHTFQVLTKRPERMREYMTAGLRVYQSTLDGARLPVGGAFWPEGEAATRIIGEISRLEAEPTYPRLPNWPLPNVWLGVSAEDQERAEMRIPELLATPAAVRFVSAEPLLGPVDLATHKALDQDGSFAGWRIAYGLHWVIVGGESGQDARPFDLAWARSVVQQCQAAGTAVFVKQLGAKPLCVDRELWERDGRSWETIEPTGARVPMKMRDPKGGEMWEWPEDLRVREFPR